MLTTIVSLDPIDFYFDVDERLYFAMPATRSQRGGTHAGRRRRPRCVGSRRRPRRGGLFKGKLDFAENRIDNATGTMRVRATFPNPTAFCSPACSAASTCPGSLPHSGILVPDEAIGADQDRRIVLCRR